MAETNQSTRVKLEDPEEWLAWIQFAAAALTRARDVYFETYGDEDRAAVCAAEADALLRELQKRDYR